MRGRKKIDPTFADIVELSVSHFAYGKTIMSLNKEFHRSVDFIGEALTMGLKNKMVNRIIASVMSGEYQSQRPDFKEMENYATKKVFSSL